MNRHLRSGSRTNRDRRDQAFCRSVIAEATRRHNEAPEIEVCPDCIGSGEIIRYVSDEFAKEQICNECNGTGWVK